VKVTADELDREIARHEPTRRLIERLERSPAPRIPRIQPPLDDSLLARLARWLRNRSLKGPRT
jgi:hypothetical protein